MTETNASGAQVPCISLLDVPVFNPLEHGIHGQPLMVPAHIFNATASVVRRLANWSRKYPSERIHSFTVDAAMNRELAEIEAEAKRLTSNEQVRRDSPAPERTP